MNTFTRVQFPFFILAISFLLLFIWLACNQTLAIDDFYFASKVRADGIWNALQTERNTWNSRWSSLLLNFGVLKVYMTISSTILILYNLFNGWLLFLFTKLLLKPFEIHSNAIVTSVAAIFFLGTFQIGEVWFWLASTTTYLTSSLLLAIIFLKIKQSQLENWLGILLVLPSIYIGGSSMPIAVIYILCLIHLTIKNLKKEQPINIQWSMLYLTITLLSLLYLLDGKGSNIRMTHFESISIFEAVILNFKLVALDVITYILPKTPLIILIGLPLLFLPINHPPINSRKLTAEIIVICFKLIVALFFYQLILTYITQDIGAARTLFPINLLFTIGFLGILYWTNRYLKSKSIPTILPKIAGMVAIITILLVTFQQVKLVSTYSNSLKNRTETLEKSSNSNQAITLSPLPPSGFLYSSEISVDSNYFSNQHLKQYYQLKQAPVLNNTPTQ